MKNIIIVTGGNRGLGKSFIDVFLKFTDSIIISISRSVHESHLNLPSSKFHFLKTDLSNPFSYDFVDLINKQTSNLSNIYFFNNASVILPINSVGKFDSNEIENSIKVNVLFPVLFTNFLIKKFSKYPITIVDISSGVYNKGIPFWSLYSSSKAYNKMFFNLIKKENINNNTKVYSIDPGVMDTGMQSNIRDSIFPDLENFNSLKKGNKLADSYEIASKIVKKFFKQ